MLNNDLHHYLQRCCNKILRIIFFRADSRSNCDDIYKKFEILKILDIHKLEVGCFVYKIFHNMLPQCFAELLKLNFAVYQRQTRKRNNIHVPLMKKVICRQSILHNGAKTWNDIPVEIRSSLNLTSFRSKLKKYLISKY